MIGGARRRKLRRRKSPARRKDKPQDFNIQKVDKGEPYADVQEWCPDPSFTTESTTKSGHKIVIIEKPPTLEEIAMLFPDD